MKKSHRELLLAASKKLPPQRPGLRDYLPEFVLMHTNGLNSADCARFLVEQGEIPETQFKSAAASIRNLLARHSPIA